MKSKLLLKLLLGSGGVLLVGLLIRWFAAKRRPATYRSQTSAEPTELTVLGRTSVDDAEDECKVERVEGAGYLLDRVEDFGLHESVELLLGEGDAAVEEAPESDLVRFSGSAPRTMAKGKEYLVQIWLHTDAQRREAEERANLAQPGGKASFAEGKAKEIASGTRIEIELTSSDAEIEDPIQLVVWQRAVTVASFFVTVPANSTAKQISFRATARFSGLEVARVALLNIEVDGPPTTARADTKSRHIERAFLSYAEPDQNAMLSRAQGMKALQRDLELFYDKSKLKPGEHFWKVIESEIDESDVLFLFWSRAAIQSEGVDREWRHKFKSAQFDGIVPVPLESPELAPPPVEFRDTMHWDDWILAHQAYRREIDRQLAEQAAAKGDTRPGA